MITLHVLSDLLLLLVILWVVWQKTVVLQRELQTAQHNIAEAVKENLRLTALLEIAAKERRTPPPAVARDVMTLILIGADGLVKAEVSSHTQDRTQVYEYGGVRYRASYHRKQDNAWIYNEMLNG